MELVGHYSSPHANTGGIRIAENRKWRSRNVQSKELKAVFLLEEVIF